MFDLFAYQLIFDHLNGVMDLHSRWCAMLLFCMSYSLRRPGCAKSPELHFLTSSNHRGKFLWPHKFTTTLLSAVTCQVTLGQSAALAVAH